MPKPTAAAASLRWADLPLDLLHDVSCRLHAAADYVHFHAVCRHWRNSLRLLPLRRPVFLPWLLAPCDATGHRKARCVFSSKDARVPHRRWVVREDDGTVASVLGDSSCRVIGDPFAGSAVSTPLPPFSSDDESKWWADHAIGTVSSDGTIVVCLFGPVNRTFLLPSFSASLLPPSDRAWTLLRKTLTIRPYEKDRFCVAYHNGKIVLCRGEEARCIIATKSAVLAGKDDAWRTPAPRECADDPKSGYVLQSQESGRTAVGLGSSQQKEGSSRDATEWVRKDGRSFANRILFLGQPSSFAVDAATLGKSGGEAYFVIKKRICGLSATAIERCFLFKYSFRDDKSEFIEQLPERWNDEDCFWLTPQPIIAPTDRPGT
ncbi:hypothetical protein PR202_gb16295 [Eleusine coracana subsp. coracana]|uniref:DUF295 domain-containing protein n=1 Tax=Eleusine coracana subsp. coracana TaxID=191504 RepID=A0AAV5EXU5_ELECO|nr:hypothetical protein QOZ80_9BG0700250 [Eleusine coracana subsp. coracana]GJN28198.1 hypothetical protein PR202_gb16295 [Eleusine coracana subsp. coracana]